MFILDSASHCDAAIAFSLNYPSLDVKNKPDFGIDNGAGVCIAIGLCLAAGISIYLKKRSDRNKRKCLFLVHKIVQRTNGDLAIALLDLNDPDMYMFTWLTSEHPFYQEYFGYVTYEGQSHKCLFFNISDERVRRLLIHYEIEHANRLEAMNQIDFPPYFPDVGSHITYSWASVELEALIQSSQPFSILNGSKLYPLDIEPMISAHSGQRVIILNVHWSEIHPHINEEYTFWTIRDIIFDLIRRIR